MARHGENIRKRKDGRWEGRFLVYSQEKEKKIYRSVYGQSYEEVRKKLTVLKSQSGDGPPKNEGSIALYDIRFSDMAQEWLAETKSRKKLSTYIKYDTIYRSHIEPLFRGAMLSEMTEAVVHERLSRHISDSVRKSIYCVLNQILRFVSQKYLISVPVLKRPDIIVRSKTIRVLTQSEQKKLFSELYQEIDIFKMAVLMCLFTGLRLGELCALKWSDIDLENKILTVNRTVQRIHADGYDTKTVLMETMPKSECSRREIPLPMAVMELLRQFEGRAEYIFGSDRPLEPRTLQYHFKKILKDAGLSDKNFHILRHTFSTNCIEGGTDVKSLSEMLGHSDVQTTLNRYVHPSMDNKRQCIDGLSRFYGQIRGQAGQDTAQYVCS